MVRQRLAGVAFLWVTLERVENSLVVGLTGEDRLKQLQH